MRKLITPIAHFVLFFVLWTCFAKTAKASLFRLESESYFNAFKNDSYQFESPFYEMLSSAYISDDQRTEWSTHLSFVADPTGLTHNKAQLHIFALKYKLIPEFVDIQMGRTLQPDLAAGSLDIMSTDFYFFNQQIRIGPFIASENEESKTLSQIYGFQLDYSSVAGPTSTIDSNSGSNTNTNSNSDSDSDSDSDLNSNSDHAFFISQRFFQKKYQQLDTNLTEDTRLTENDLTNTKSENFYKFSAKKLISSIWSPEFLFDAQIQLDQPNLDRLEAGVDFYPGIESFAKLRLLSYDHLPQSGPQQSIYSIFSMGRLYEIRAQFQNRKSASHTQGLSLYVDEYQLQTHLRTQGFGIDWQNQINYEWGFADNTSYIFSSYGGKVFGNRLLLQSNFKQELYALLDVSYYEKITSSKHNAINSELGCSSYIDKKYKLSFGGELNSNNVLAYDLRAFIKLTFLIWNES